MHNNTTLERDIFWTILFHLEDLKSPIKLKDFLQQNNLKRDDFFIFTEHSHTFGLSIDLKDIDEEMVISPLSYHREFGDVVLEKAENKEIARSIQKCIEKGNVTCELTFVNNSKMTVYPWRVLLFENRLSVIGEEVDTKRLITIEVNEVLEMKNLDISYESLFSRLEVEDFINAMRLVDGCEQRLILKIKNGEHLELPSEYIFLGNPYTTTNQYGDIIWAATVEKSEFLFDWLYSMRNKIVILDPTTIQEDLDLYCESRKAS